ncbi:MAG: hypothetical protein RSD62_08585, partial [Ruthenibacterium sp.]
CCAVFCFSVFQNKLHKVAVSNRQTKRNVISFVTCGQDEKSVLNIAASAIYRTNAQNSVVL